MVLGTSQARRTLLASRAGRAARRTACPCWPRAAGRQEGRLPPAASPATGQRWLCWPRAAGGCGSALHPGTASSSPPCSPVSSGGRAWDHRFQQAAPCRQHRTPDGTAEHSLIQPRVCEDVSASSSDTPTLSTALRPLESRWSENTSS